AAKMPVRIYTPCGELVPGMAYLVRRILENTSNESFLRQRFTEGAKEDVLLSDPKKSEFLK
ncbi:MAG: proline dehydrogenase family protein, partial [Candidatus Sumerlaeia bacterium]|nr:proline dehydrogenase family protein [Candidatus Sumerlaeia bacterium]